MEHPPEHRESLWLLIAGPLAWLVHFCLCYGTAAIWCAKLAGPDRSLSTVRVLIGVYTVVALIGIGIVGWVGYRRHGWLSATRRHDFDTAEDRHKFLGFATLLLAGLSAVAVLYEALVAVFFRTCH
jgi:hypothetical protein